MLFSWINYFLLIYEVSELFTLTCFQGERNNGLKLYEGPGKCLINYVEEYVKNSFHLRFRGLESTGKKWVLFRFSEDFFLHLNI